MLKSTLEHLGVAVTALVLQAGVVLGASVARQKGVDISPAQQAMIQATALAWLAKKLFHVQAPTAPDVAPPELK